MRLLCWILLLFMFSCPAWAEDDEETAPPKRPPPRARKYPRRRPPPSAPKPTEKPPEDEPPPSTPVDLDPTPEPSLPRFDPAWRACREDKDCIAIDTRCGWGCINGSFEKPASHYYRQLAPFIECASTTLDDKPNPICVKKECVCQK